MARAHEIAIASETGAFEKGIKSGVIRPLEDADDALEDLGRNRGPEQLERGLRDAQEESKDLSREIDKTARNIETEFRDAYRKAGDSSEKFERGASENVEGFKDEAIQNFSEVASSWQGDLQGMADGVQGLTGGLASSLTPGIGIPIAILGAVAGAFLQSWATATEEAKQQISDMYDDMIESGYEYLSQDFILQGISEQYKEHYDDIISRSKELGQTHSTVAAAMAGDETAINQILDDQNAKRQKEIDLVNASSGTLEEKSVKLDAIDAKYARQNEWVLEIAKNEQTAGQKASDALKGRSDYLENHIRQFKDVSVEVDKLGNKLITLPDGQQVLIDVDTGRATTRLDKFQDDADGVIEHVSGREAVVKLRVDDRAAKNWRPPTYTATVKVARPGQNKYFF